MKSTKPITYQALKAELDELLDTLQRSDTDVDAALAGHTRGMELITQLETYLQTAENKLVSLPTNRS